MKSPCFLLLIFLLSGSVSAQITDDSSRIYSITSLKDTAANEKYGFTPEFPVKVGTGPKSGPANQRAYLELLIDPSGNQVTYERLGSCCGYPSENSPFGMALLDKYEIRFTDKEGKKKKRIVYISFYDYEEPKILIGFSAKNPG